MPRKENLPDLLGELLKQTDGYDWSFNFMQPLTSQGGEGYEQFNLEMQFDAGYASAIRYLYRLEKSFPFIKTTKVLLASKEDETNSDLEVTLFLSAVLADNLEEKMDLADLRIPLTELPEGISRNPFTSKFKPQLVQDAIGAGQYSLSGIVSKGKNPTAIINNEVYKIGDWIGDSQVQEITAQRVVLQKGPDVNILTLGNKSIKEAN